MYLIFRNFVSKLGLPKTIYLCILPFVAGISFITQIKSRIQIAREENPKLPVILYGHSMGGLIAIMATIRSPDLVNGLILEAAAIKIHPSSGAWWQIMAAKLLSRIAPNLKVGDIDKRLISRDPDTIQSIIEDENCATNGGVSAGFAVRLLTAQAYVIEKMNTITVKTLIASGTNDQLTCKSGSDLAAEKITTNTYKLYDGAYHQLHAERGDITKQYISDVMEWIENVL